MNTEALVGFSITGVALILIAGLTWSSRRAIDRIWRKNLKTGRDIEREFSDG